MASAGLLASTRYLLRLLQTLSLQDKLQHQPSSLTEKLTASGVVAKTAASREVAVLLHLQQMLAILQQSMAS